MFLPFLCASEIALPVFFIKAETRHSAGSGARYPFARHLARRVAQPRVEPAIRRKIAAHDVFGVILRQVRSSSRNAANRCRKRRRNLGVWQTNAGRSVTSSGLTLKTCAAAVVWKSSPEIKALMKFSSFENSAKIRSSI